MIFPEYSGDFEKILPLRYAVEAILFFIRKHFFYTDNFP